MKRLILKPDGWPCKLIDCPPGLFLYNDFVNLKTEYAKGHLGNNTVDAYCDTGETFCVGDDAIVQSLIYEWEEES